MNHHPPFVVETSEIEAQLRSELNQFCFMKMTPALRQQIRAVIARHVPELPVTFIEGGREVCVGSIDAAQFLRMTGTEPSEEDLERVNCSSSDVGHFLCGVCEIHDSPRFRCGCLRPIRRR
jgi:hypothetical protein